MDINQQCHHCYINEHYKLLEYLNSLLYDKNIVIDENKTSHKDLKADLKILREEYKGKLNGKRNKYADKFIDTMEIRILFHVDYKNALKAIIIKECYFKNNYL